MTATTTNETLSRVWKTPVDGESENENKNFSEKALDENENGVKINESLKRSDK